MRDLRPSRSMEFRKRCASESLLLDVREPCEHDIYQVEGARLLPLSHRPETLHQLDQECPTMVLRQHGISSRQAAHYLLRDGFTEAENLEGGMSAWARVQVPGIPDY